MIRTRYTEINSASNATEQTPDSAVQLGRVGYVVKMYPRFSETFIVNEILAHEAAGLDIDIISLRAPVDGRFHDMLARVRGSVTYMPVTKVSSDEFWRLLHAAAGEFPNLWAELQSQADVDARDVIQAIEVARVARDRKLVHLHAHFATVAAVVARLASRLVGITYSITAHAKDIYHEDVDDRQLERLVEDAAAVVTVSQYNLEYLTERFGQEGTAGVRKIYNGLDLDRFAFEEPTAAERRVVAVGRLVEKKGFQDLIEACAVLRDRGRPVDCRIAGTGPLESVLRNRVKELALDEWVDLSGAMPQHDVIELVRGSSVLAAPCIVGADGNRDGMPTVLLESMALGTPVVATPVTGIPELVRDEDTGLIVPEGDPEALADSIDRILGDRNLAIRLAKSARNLIEEQFDIHKTTARQRRLFSGRAAAEQRA